MVSKIVWGAVGLALVGLLLWAYGEAREVAGFNRAVAAQAEAAIKRNREMMLERQAGRDRIAALKKMVDQQRRERDAKVRDLLAQIKSYADWYHSKVHPCAVDLIWGDGVRGDGAGCQRVRP